MIFELGRTLSGSKAVLSNQPNPHAFISGQSGSGKSYFLKKLLLQAVNQGCLCIILDYSSDFSNYVPPDGIPFQQVDATTPFFSLNPLSAATGQSPDARAQQLLAALHSVFRMGPRATVALRRATAEYLEKSGTPRLTGLWNHISEIEDAGQGLEAAKEPLELLTSLVHCGHQPISLNLDSPGLCVVDFTNICDQNLCKLLLELTLQAIWMTHTPEQPPLILVLDEAQRLNWGQESMAPRILREGRKFRISGWFASQWVHDKETVAALSQAALQAHFRPDDQNLDKLAKSFCQSKVDLPKYQDLIRSLCVGQFLWRRTDGKCVLVNVEK